MDLIGSEQLEVAKMIIDLVRSRSKSAKVMVWGGAALDILNQRQVQNLSFKVYGVSGKVLEDLLRYCFPKKVRFHWWHFPRMVLELGNGTTVELSIPFEASGPGEFLSNDSSITTKREKSLVAFSTDALYYSLDRKGFVSPDDLVASAKEGNFAIVNRNAFAANPLLHLYGLSLVNRWGLRLSEEDLGFLSDSLCDHEDFFWDLSSSAEFGREELGRFVDCPRPDIVMRYLWQSGLAELMFPWIEHDKVEETLTRAGELLEKRRNQNPPKMPGNFASAYFWVVLMHSFFSVMGYINEHPLSLLKNAFGALLLESLSLVRPDAVTRLLIMDTLVLLLAKESDDLAAFLEGEPNAEFLESFKASGMIPVGGAIEFETLAVDWSSAKIEVKDQPGKLGRVVQLSTELIADFFEPLLDPGERTESLRRVDELRKHREGVVTFLLNGEQNAAFLLDAAGRSDLCSESLARASAVQVLLRRVVECLIKCGLTKGREFPVRVKLDGPFEDDPTLPIFSFIRNEKTRGGILLPDWSLFASNSFVQRDGWDYHKMRMGATVRRPWDGRDSRLFFRGEDPVAGLSMVRALESEELFDVLCCADFAPDLVNRDLYLSKRYLLDLVQREGWSGRFKELLLFRSVVIKINYVFPEGRLVNFYDGLFKAGRDYEELQVHCTGDSDADAQEVLRVVEELKMLQHRLESNPGPAELMAETGFESAMGLSEVKVVEYASALVARYLGAYFPWVIEL